MLDEYRNLDLRAPALDAIGRLTRNDIIWAEERYREGGALHER